MSVRNAPAEPEAQEYASLVLDAADVGLLTIGRDGHSHGTAAFARHLGLPPGESLSLQALLDRVSDAERAELAACTASWMQGEAVSADFATHVTDGEGHRRALRVKLVPQGQSLLLLTTVNLGTQSELLRSVSHALRSPLNALLGWVHVLALKRPDDSDVAAIAVRLDRSAKALLRTVNDLQDLDHLKRGKFRLEKRPFKLFESIEAAIDAQEELAASRDIQLVAEIADECDTSVEGDPLRLRQLFEHLLRNAIHHSESHSQIRINCARVGTSLQVSIADTGSGLSREQIASLFQMHSGEVSFSSGGLGAGLTLAQAIVERHQGTLEARSPGSTKGLTVVVTLPARVRPEQKKAG